jgi:hypothetical protein
VHDDEMVIEEPITGAELLTDRPQESPAEGGAVGGVVGGVVVCCQFTLTVAGELEPLALCATTE